MLLEYWARFGAAVVAVFAVAGLLRRISAARARRRPRPPAPEGYSVQVEPRGRAAFVHYREEDGARTIRFDAELGGANTLLIVYTPSSAAWPSKAPWAAERRAEILDRVGQELVRQSSTDCFHEIHEDWIAIEMTRS